jgi:DNA-binding XRE family transcriptional regulator
MSRVFYSQPVYKKQDLIDQGNQLRRSRERANLSKSEAAYIIGVDDATYNQLEKGNKKIELQDHIRYVAKLNDQFRLNQNTTFDESTTSTNYDNTTTTYVHSSLEDAKTKRKRQAEEMVRVLKQRR